MLHPFGCFFSGIMQGKVGKKYCMIMANVPSTIGWILLYLADSSVYLCASASLMGFSTGFGAGSTSSYVGEISEPRLRGSLSSLGNTAARVGSLSIYVLGSYFDWRTVALLSTSCPIICICLIVFVCTPPRFGDRSKSCNDRLCFLFPDTGVSRLVSDEGEKRQSREGHVLVTRMGETGNDKTRVPGAHSLQRSIRHLRQSSRGEK